MTDKKLVILVVMYLVGVVNGWIVGYEYAQRHSTEIKVEA